VRGAQNGCLLYFLDVMIVRHRRRRRDDDDNNNNHPMAVGWQTNFCSDIGSSAYPY